MHRCRDDTAMAEIPKDSAAPEEEVLPRDIYLGFDPSEMKVIPHSWKSPEDEADDKADIAAILVPESIRAAEAVAMALKEHVAFLTQTVSGSCELVLASSELVRY